MENIFFYETAIGTVTIAEEEGAITRLYLRDCDPMSEGRVQRTPLLDKAAAELNEYLAGKRRIFDLPLASKGGLFTKKVWEALQKIPYGTTASYGDIAWAVGNPRGARAVGQACGKNSILLMIPCHRVIAGDGSLGGFGLDLGLKVRLLALEGVKLSASGRKAKKPAGV